MPTINTFADNSTLREQYGPSTGNKYVVIDSFLDKRGYISSSVHLRGTDKVTRVDHGGWGTVRIDCTDTPNQVVIFVDKEQVDVARALVKELQDLIQLVEAAEEVAS